MRPLITFIVALCITIAARAQQTPQASDPFALPPDAKIPLVDMDSMISLLKALPWSPPPDLQKLGPDHAGRGVEDDIRDYMLSDSSLAKIQAARDAAAAATPADTGLVPRPELEVLVRALGTEFCHMRVIGDYWTMRGAIAYRARLLQQPFSALPAGERGSWEARKLALDQRVNNLRSAMPGQLTDCANERPPDAKAFRSLQAEYGTLRRHAIERLAELFGDDAPTDWISRPSACPAPSGTTTGTSKLAVSAKPDMSSLYPSTARNRGMEGSVKVRIEVDAGGCVSRAAILDSSGEELLDEAALKAAFGYQFTPGEENGKPIGGRFALPVSFSLRDAEGP